MCHEETNEKNPTVLIKKQENQVTKKITCLRKPLNDLNTRRKKTPTTLSVFFMITERVVCRKQKKKIMAYSNRSILIKYIVAFAARQTTLTPFRHDGFSPHSTQTAFVWCRFFLVPRRAKIKSQTIIFELTTST